jgi:hypothetical protein
MYRIFQMKEITHLLLLLLYVSTHITIGWSAPYSTRTTEDARNLEDFVHKIKEIYISSERFTSKFDLDYANIYNYNTIHNIVGAHFVYESNVILGHIHTSIIALQKLVISIIAIVSAALIALLYLAVIIYQK